MEYITDLKRWINNETITARDYVYERDTIVNTVNQIIDYATQLDDELPNIVLSNNQPENQKNGDIWLDINGG